MSYNYEINCNTNIKNKDQSSQKYIYANNEDDSQLYIFEVILKDKFNKTSVIRKIKKSNQGNLLCNDDNIQYKSIEKIKVTVIDANITDLSIVVKETINHDLSYTTVLNDNIYLEINKTSNDFMNINYNISMN
jgi:hypothetical protein